MKAKVYETLYSRIGWRSCDLYRRENRCYRTSFAFPIVNKQVSKFDYLSRITGTGNRTWLSAHQVCAIQHRDFTHQFFSSCLTLTLTFSPLKRDFFFYNVLRASRTFEKGVCFFNRRQLDEFFIRSMPAYASVCHLQKLQSTRFEYVDEWKIRSAHRMCIPVLVICISQNDETLIMNDEKKL